MTLITVTNFKSLMCTALDALPFKYNVDRSKCYGR